MRLTILGGGGFRVPLVYSALLADGNPIDTVVLHDTDPTRVRTIHAVLFERFGGHQKAPRIVVEGDLAAALSGADFVFSAIRVAGLRGRICDERSALAEGVLGQETVGAGGVLYGLRTVPVAVRIAELVRRHAPDAWLINFTNPAGMVTEAMSSVLGDRVIGICDSPTGLFHRVSRVMDLDPEHTFFDYAGLNHLGWLRRVLVDGRDVLPDLLADDDALGSIEEGRLFGASWLRANGMIPNEYLYYYYFTEDAMGSLTGADETRGEVLRQQQKLFYEAAEQPGAADRWDVARHERERSYMAEGRAASGAGNRDESDLDGGGYERVALELMRSLAGDDGLVTSVLNVRNQSAISGLDADAVVEVPCLVGGNGARPLAVGTLEPTAFGLVGAVKAVERGTIEAALTGSRAAAVEALASHPLVNSAGTAERILARELAELPELRTVLTND